MLGYPNRPLPPRALIKVPRTDGTYEWVQPGSYRHRYLLEQLNKAYEDEIEKYYREQRLRGRISEASGSMPTYKQEGPEFYNPNEYNTSGVYRPGLTDRQRRERLRWAHPEGRWTTPGTPRTQRRSGPYVQGFRGYRSSEAAAEASAQALYRYLPLDKFDPENLLVQRLVIKLAGKLSYEAGTIGERANLAWAASQGLASELGQQVISRGASTGIISRSDFDWDPRTERFRRIRSAHYLLRSSNFKGFWKELLAATKDGKEIPTEGTWAWMEYQALLKEAVDRFARALQMLEEQERTQTRAGALSRYLNVIAEMPADLVRAQHPAYQFPLSKSKVAIYPDLAAYQQIQSLINHIRNISYGMPGKLVSSIAEQLSSMGFHGKVMLTKPGATAWKAPAAVAQGGRQVTFNRVKELYDAYDTMPEQRAQPQAGSTAPGKAPRIDASRLYRRARFNITAMNELPIETVNEIDRVIQSRVENYYRDLGDFMRSEQELSI